MKSNDPNLKITEEKHAGSPALRLEHPAMGKVRVARFSGNVKNRLFMSNVENFAGISIEIDEACLVREGASEWVHSGKRIVTIELSPAQWADLLTNLNGEGTPCTIRWDRSRETPNIPPLPMLGTVMQHVETQFEQAINDLELLDPAAMAGVREALEKLPGKHRTVVTEAFNNLVSRVKSKIPYIRDRWEEAAVKTVEQLKQEATAFIAGVAQRNGIDAMNMPRLGETLDRAPKTLDMKDEAPK